MRTNRECAPLATMMVEPVASAFVGTPHNHDCLVSDQSQYSGWPTIAEGGAEFPLGNLPYTGCID